MASSCMQVAGPHASTFEEYYSQLDPAKSGQVGALKAATFLKKSSLPDSVLSKIWDLSDPQGNGYLDKHGVFVALKLVSLAQIGVEVSIDNLNKQTPLPKMIDGISNLSAPEIDWKISDEEGKKYNQLFDSLGPINDRLPGTKVKPIMINSKLPVDILGKIWDLSDIDNDGFLDRDEFHVGMHLIYKALENVPVPSSLPAVLLPASKRKKSLPGAVSVLPPGQARASPTPSLGSISSTDSAQQMNTNTQPAVQWIVNASDKAKYDAVFKTVDQDLDGFVTGVDVKNILLQSGLPQAVLAHIWSLCDVNSNGMLNSEQFALAMYLINQKMQGQEIPATLTLEMTPPSLLPKPGTGSEESKVEESEMSKELQVISKEIEDLQREKMQLEQDIAQKEADITIRNGEVNSLQNMLNSLSSTLKQLEAQKGEAQKRLDDLDSQKVMLDKDIVEIQNKVQDELSEVERLKLQLKDQADNTMAQETQLNAKRQELNDLRNEEAKLQEQVQSGKSQLEGLDKSLQDTHLLITQTKSKITQMQDTQNQVSDLITQYDSAISSGDVSTISELSQRTITPTLIEQEYSRLSNTAGSSPVSSVGAFSMSGGAEPFDELKDEDPFKNKDPFTNGFSSVHSSVADDPFKSDPFKDQLDSGDPFKDISVKEDPFSGSDPFAENSFSMGSNDVDNAGAKSDPFDPFGLSSGSSLSNSQMASDPFGGDPFGAPPVAPRSESPTPALPPKKSKAPPPRPAPPKGMVGSRGPTRAAPPAPDPFASNSTKLSNDSKDFDDPFATFDRDNSKSVFNSNMDNNDIDPFSSTDSTKNTSDPFSSTGDGAQDSFANFANFN